MTSWTTALQTSLSFTLSQSLLKLSSQWCHPTISSSVTLFSSCPRSFPESRFFLMSQLFASGGQSIGVSASASVLPMNIQGWFLLGLTGFISLSKGLSRIFSRTTVWKHQFFFFLIISFNWRLITLQYYSGFCHTLTWISHGCTCVPHPEPPPTSVSIASLRVIPVHQPWAPWPMHQTWTGDLFHIW